MGLLVQVLKADGAREQRTLVQWHGVPVDGPSEPSPEARAVLVAQGPMGGDVAYDAVNAPVDPPGHWRRERHAALVGPMHAARFIWTSDGRFAAGSRPLRYFDRWETPEQCAASSD